MTFTHSGITLNGHSGDLAAGDRQRHGEAVIDRHLVGDGHVELIEDEVLDQVPGELRMAVHRRHRPRAEAFVGHGELRRGA